MIGPDIWRLRGRAGSVKLPRWRNFWTITLELRGEGVVRLNGPERVRADSGVLKIEAERFEIIGIDVSPSTGIRDVLGEIKPMPSIELIWNIDWRERRWLDKKWAGISSSRRGINEQVAHKQIKRANIKYLYICARANVPKENVFG